MMIIMDGAPLKKIDLEADNLGAALTVRNSRLARDENSDVPNMRSEDPRVCIVQSNKMFTSCDLMK